MSARAIGWAFEQRGLNTTARLVLFVLADAADKFGRCWPSINTIARCADISERSVQNGLKELVEAGLLERSPQFTEAGRQTSTIYQLAQGARVLSGMEVPDQPDEGRVQALHPGVHGGGEGADFAPSGVHTAAPLNMFEPPEGTKNPLYPPSLGKPRSTEKPGTSPKLGATATPPVALPEWVPRDAWEAFEAMRKAKRAPLTKRAIELIVEKLGRYRADGHSPRDVLQQSVERGWTGVFPVRREPVGQRTEERESSLMDGAL